MTPLSRLRRAGPAALKHSISSLSFGHGHGVYTDPNFWLSDDLRDNLPFPSMTSTSGHHERIETSFEGYVRQGYKTNGIVFACVLARMFPFSEALFRYQEMDEAGVPGSLSYGPGLSLLDEPWPGATTGDLLARMEQDASLAGNSYWAMMGGRLRRLRPDWVTIVTGIPGAPGEPQPFDIDAEVLGYIYHPKPPGKVQRPEPVVLSKAAVAHYAPVPDPEAQWRGMSWMTPVLSEIDGDSAANRHKLKFFENGATSNVIITYDASMKPEHFTKYVELFESAHKGVDKAYKTIHLGGGADAKTVGADMKQLDFKVTQGAGETRIAAASGVGAIIAQLSEGMQGSSLNAGNYSSAKRRFADMTLRPLWRNAAGCLSKFANVPANHRLWYADKHIDFLQEDALDSAEIFDKRAQSIRTLTDGGYEPESIIAAVKSENPSLLVHSGKTSVQLIEPATTPQGDES